MSEALSKSPEAGSQAAGSGAGGGGKVGIGIGKRKIESDGEEEALDRDTEERERRDAHMKRVRADLSSFLSSKGVDTTRHMSNITIELKVRSEPFNPRKKGPGNAAMAQGDRYQATFKLADGSVYSQKAEVYAALLKMPAAKGAGASASAAPAPKAGAAPVLKVATSPKAAGAAAASGTGASVPKGFSTGTGPTPLGAGNGSGSATAAGSATAPASNTVTLRKEAHEASMAAFNALASSLPCAVGEGLLLHALGNLDPRPTFHSPTQLYSMGYRAEITVADTESNRAFVGITSHRSNVSLPATFLCYIKSVQKGAPVFKMTNMATAVAYEMETEEAVFRQHFPGIEKAGTGVSTGADGVGDAACGGVTGAATGGIGPWTSVAPFSFFNFEVEKLMEGLKGALLCHSYKMHCQRGYPVKYSDAASAAKAKRCLVISRHNAAKTSPVDLTANAAANKAAASKVEKAAAEASISNAFKKQQAVSSGASQLDKDARAREKEATSLEKEEQKRIAKVQREQAKVQKEEEKKEEAKVRAAAQQRKMQEALDNKYRNGFRADVKKAVAKAQREAASSVLDAFDAEEADSGISMLMSQLTGHEEEPPGATSNASSETISETEERVDVKQCKESLTDVLRRVAKPCADVLLADLWDTLQGEATSDCDAAGARSSSSSGGAMSLGEDLWDPLLRAANTLSLHRDFLNLQVCPSAELLARSLVAFASQRDVHARLLTDITARKKRGKVGAAAAAVKAEVKVEAMEVVKTEQPDASANAGADADDDADADADAMDTVAGEEAEASFEDLPNPPAGAAAESVAVLQPEEPADLAAALRGQAHADLDRLLLCLTQAVCAPLHTLLDLDDEVTVNSYRNDIASTHGVRLPLNELTYPEIARMSLLAHVMPCMSFTVDETRAVLRGGSATGGLPGRGSGIQAGYRNAKNVMRHLRYRLLSRNASLYGDQKNGESESRILPATETASGAGAEEDRLLFLRQHVRGDQQHLYQPHGTRFSSRGHAEGSNSSSHMPESDFLDADDYSRLVSSLQAAGAADSEFPEVYKRCARVLLKLCTSACGKPLLWDTSFREYLQVIRHPMTLAVVGTRLLKMEYGLADASVASACYADMRLVAINSIVYHSEAVVTNALAHKALHVMHRYAYEWVFSRNRPALEACTDSVCILSGKELASAAVTLKCGRCSAQCSLDALHEASVNSSSKILSNVTRHASLIAPNQELVDRSHEEWVCPLCVEEDSVDMRASMKAWQSSTSGGDDQGSFWVDEFGPSAVLPWHLHTAYSRALNRAAENFPALQGPLWESICMLASQSRTSFNATVPDADTLDGERIVLGTSPAPQVVVTYADVQKQLANAEQPWTSSERVNLILSLADLLKGSAANPVGSEASADIYDKTGSLNDLCGKLVRLSTQCSPFKEAEFMRIVRDIAGEEGVLLAREALDRINNERVNNSTDLRELMTGAGLASENSGTTFSDTAVIDKFRDRDAEDTLLNRCIDCKAIEDPSKSSSAKSKEKLPARLNQELLAAEKGWAEQKCQYCGLSELDICSPFVVGHSPLDHAYHQSKHGDRASMFATGTLDGEYNMEYTRVYIRSGLEDLKAPPLSLPYWPSLDTKFGQAMLQAMGAKPIAFSLDQTVDLTDTDVVNGTSIPDVQPTIVHQICALQMFKARLERRNHELRRKRRALAGRIVGLTGLYTVCLGRDMQGREYWKFPTAVSPALFVCQGVPEDALQHEFRASQLGRAAKHVGVTKSKAGKEYEWTMVTERVDLQTILTAVQLPLLTKLDPKMRERMEGLAEELELLLKNKVAFPEAVTSEIHEVISLTETTAEVKTEARETATAGIKVEPTDMEVEVIDGSEPGAADEAGVSESKDGAADKVKEEPEKKVREKREGGALGSWLVKGSGGASMDHSQISYLHSMKKGQHMDTTANFDQFAYADPATMDLPESQPVELRYLPQKGQTVLPVYIIDQQSAFDEKRCLLPSGDYYEDDAAAEEMEDTSFEEYFTFNSRQRKFIVLSMFNNQDRKVRVPKGAVNLRFEVHKDARTEPLVTIDLTEMWSDGLYYFSMPNFKRAGNYKLTFTAETVPEYASAGKPAVDLRFIKPVTFDVTVQASRTLCGAADALAKLNAHTFTTRAGRRNVIDKIRFSSHEYIQALRSSCDDGTITECNANKLAILILFNALPCGSLTLATEVEDVQGGLAHASGWSDELEEAWFNSLVRARTALELMECVLLLEFYICKSWLTAPNSRLFNALPAPQFALRCASFSSVALRAFSLDRCLAYGTVVKEPRAPRISKAAMLANKTAAAEPAAAAASRTSGRKERVSYAEEDSFDNASSEEEGDEDVGTRGRSRRAAASTASNRIKNQSGKQQVSDEEDGYDGLGPTGGSTRRRGGGAKRAPQDAEEDDEEAPSNAPADSWVCGMCTCQNSLRARSCEACGEKRSAATAASSGKTSGGSKQRKSKYQEEEDEEEEEDEDGSEGYDWAQLMVDCGVGDEVDADSRADVAGRQLSLLRSLHADIRSGIFWTPVPPDTPGYHELIKKPMDLGTITDEVVSGSYYVDDGQSTTAGIASNAYDTFLADVALVWANCKQYNGKGALYNLAVTLDQGFRARYARWVTNHSMSGARPENPNIKE